MLHKKYMGIQKEIQKKIQKGIQKGIHEGNMVIILIIVFTYETSLRPNFSCLFFLA